MSILLLAMLVMTPAPTAKRYAVSGKVFFDDSGSHCVTVYWYDEDNELLGYDEVYSSGNEYYIQISGSLPGDDYALLAEPSWDTQSVKIESDIDFPEDYVDMPGGFIHYHNFYFPIPIPPYPAP